MLYSIIENVLESSVRHPHVTSGIDYCFKCMDSATSIASARDEERIINMF